MSLEFHYGPDTTDDDVALVGSHLQRFFVRYGLRFQTTRPAVATALQAAMTGSLAEIDEAARRAGIPTDRDLEGAEREQFRRIVGDVVFRELREFVYETPVEAAAPDVRLAVVETLVAPQLAAEIFPDGDTPAGLGLSPALMAELASDDTQADLISMIGLDRPFVPVLLVGLHDILQGCPDNLVAHECGHALGLVHGSDDGNVMNPEVERSCTAVLSDEQVARLRGSPLQVDISPLRRVTPDFASRIHAAVMASTRRSLGPHSLPGG